MATRRLLGEMIAQFEKTSPHRVALESVGGLDAAKRVRAGEPLDVVVLAREVIDDLFTGIDLLVTPTLRFVAPLAGQDERELRGELTKLTWPFNVSGAPALALPCGPAEDSLPASMQLVGRPGDDARVLAAGALLERALKA